MPKIISSIPTHNMCKSYVMWQQSFSEVTAYMLCVCILEA